MKDLELILDELLPPLPPSLDGLHLAACSVLVPEMASQQLGTALDSNRARLVCDVAEECCQACCQACRDPQEQWRARCTRPRLACACR
jgi:hypothetical protein